MATVLERNTPTSRERQASAPARISLQRWNRDVSVDSRSLLMTRTVEIGADGAFRWCRRAI
jgi:hypothetical protein